MTQERAIELIISASRRTDIPAFYFDWFLNRIDDGFLYVRNPMNHKQVSKVLITSENTDCIVFWTKNPIPALEHLHRLESFDYYFQYTLNAYPIAIERNLPSLNKRISAFKCLARRIGPERVIWRYDPIILTDEIDVDFHIKKFEYIASELGEFTRQVVVSLIDDYKKNRNNLKSIKSRPMSKNEQDKLFKAISHIAVINHLRVTTCSESIDLTEYGINAGKCIDDELISRIIGKKLDIKKDPNQRDECLCVESIDIGAYDSCHHGCIYCYANDQEDTLMKNIKKHDIDSPLLIGEIEEEDKITLRKLRVYKNEDVQLKIF